MNRRAQRGKKSLQKSYEEGDPKVIEILNLIDQLYKLRLVDRLACPIDFKHKQKLFIAYKQKFRQLHLFLQQIQKDIPKDSQSTADRVVTNNSTRGIKQIIKKEDVRKIQSAYTQVLIEGSFKHFPMVAKVAGLPEHLQIVNIHNWAVSCLEQKVSDSCC